MTAQANPVRNPIQNHRVVSHEQWIAERTAFMAREKELTRLRDELSRQRRDLPWEKVTKAYVFDGPRGQETLAELFEQRSQLVVYHFMFNPAWDEGCPACSFWADNFDGIDIHLAHRDITFLAISRAPLAKLDAYRKRMGWSFKWVSAGDTDFNYDFQASFAAEIATSGAAYYNYGTGRRVGEDMPGVSVFYRDGTGDIYHTYSAYSRGIDLLNGAYNYIDLTPKGRDEDGLPSPAAWMRRHDRYED
jgi:predicted dithiol-disulfide oxidoreductase (DUF899 family)